MPTRTEISNWLWDHIQQITIGKDNKDPQYDGYDCSDNYRFAAKDNPRQIKQYEKQQADGCCGSYDSEVVCPLDGKTYLIGFNYGH